MTTPAQARLAFAAARALHADTFIRLAVERDYWIACTWARLGGMSPAAKLCALRVMGCIR